MLAVTLQSEKMFYIIIVICGYLAGSNPALLRTSSTDVTYKCCLPDEKENGALSVLDTGYGKVSLGCLQKYDTLFLALSLEIIIIFQGLRSYRQPVSSINKCNTTTTTTYDHKAPKEIFFPHQISNTCSLVQKLF